MQVEFMIPRLQLEFSLFSLLHLSAISSNVLLSSATSLKHKLISFGFVMLWDIADLHKCRETVYRGLEMSFGWSFP